MDRTVRSLVIASAVVTSLACAPAPPAAIPASNAPTTASECAARWSPLMTRVAAQRPSPTTSATVRFKLIARPGDRGGVIELAEIVALGDKRHPVSDGPFSVASHSGSWIELQDALGKVVFTQRATFLEERIEVHGLGGKPTNMLTCPKATPFTVITPNLAGATQLVLFHEPLDGQTTDATVELARFVIPAG